ncbi:MAG: hypothetical protein R3D57_02935 [Hyphomicrobiaceae bacterium]
MLALSVVLLAALAIVGVTITIRRTRSVGGRARSRRPLWRWLAGAMAALCLVLAAVFTLAFHNRYWRWRDCFNELGRCYDPANQEIYLEQAGLVWGGLAALAIAGALIALAGWWRRRG